MWTGQLCPPLQEEAVVFLRDDIYQLGWLWVHKEENWPHGTHFPLWNRFTDIYVGQPVLQGEFHSEEPINPQQCRLSDITYSAPIHVNIEYTRNKEIIVQQDGKRTVGRMPIMLRCDRSANPKTSTLITLNTHLSVYYCSRWIQIFVPSKFPVLPVSPKSLFWTAGAGWRGRMRSSWQT